MWEYLLNFGTKASISDCNLDPQFEVIKQNEQIVGGSLPNECGESGCVMPMLMLEG